MVRQFKLKNAEGEIYNLYDSEHFGYNPDNLGISLTNSLVQSGANFLLVNTALNHQQFQINVIFGGEELKDQYPKHRALLQFLDKTPLTLVYKRPGVDEMNRDIALAQLPLSEIKEPFLIDSQLTFDFLSPWYRYVLFASTAEQEFVPDTGKIYAFDMANGEQCYTYSPMRVPATHSEVQGYVYDIKGRVGTQIHITNNSIYLDTQETSPLIIEISAPIETLASPIEMELYQNNELIQNDAYFTTLNKGEKLVITTGFRNQTATKINKSGKGVPVYFEQDLTKSNFITAPIGESTFICKSDNANIKIWLKEEVLL